MASRSTWFVDGVQLHGAQRLRSWTKLEATAPMGNDTIFLSEDVDWGVGDRLVVATSEVDMSQTEEVGACTRACVSRRPRARLAAR